MIALALAGTNEIKARVEDRDKIAADRDNMIEARDNMAKDWDKWLDYSDERCKDTKEIAAGRAG